MQKRTEIRSHNESCVALLATGDELTQGDILNTNGQRIARELIDQGFALGTHIIVPDNEAEITRAMEFLLSNHDILIITGGLGPTTDDRTRFALARATQHKLTFDEASWQRIIERLSYYKLTLHESNRQQCLFPEGAEIIPNPNGTASACRMMIKNKVIFMLPGPPVECLHIFHGAVLPWLIKNHRIQKLTYLKWRLFGVSEGEIATRLDSLVAPYDVVTGYRWDYPYLEFKIRSEQNDHTQQLTTLVEKAIADYMICSAESTASESLIQIINQQQNTLIINDHATGGLLEFTLTTPKTIAKCKFQHSKPAESHNAVYIEINGLEEVWSDSTKQNQHTHIHLRIESNDKSGKQEEYRQKVSYRHSRVLYYAVEYICHKLTLFLQAS